MYKLLSSTRTVKTVQKLKQRIEERFPTSGLLEVCRELCSIASESKQKSAQIAKPNLWLRFLITAVIVLMFGALVYSIRLLDLSFEKFSFGELIQIIEAGVNEIILIGAAILFLVTVETRIKRTKSLESLHELRSIAHVIDMHQLTKDPSTILHQRIVTPSSPKRELTAYQLSRYLDYCSEMLALTGKIAALYAQHSRDAVVLGAVNEVENLASGLSRKIWQKIMVLEKYITLTPVNVENNSINR